MMRLSWSKLYWLILLMLLILQGVYTFGTMVQLRTEEIDESVRSVYWLQNHQFYGVYKNIGWYTPLLFIYNFFGFSFLVPKLFKLSLALISLFCTASLLKKYLGPKKAIIPLITIGLSPSILHYMILGIPPGIDFLYIPIILYFIDIMDITKGKYQLLKAGMLGGLIMLAWLSYPVIAFYLPVISFFLVNKTIKGMGVRGLVLKRLLIVMGGALITLILIISPVTNKYNFLLGEGFLRGSLKIDSSLSNFSWRFNSTLENLFIRSHGYYTEIKNVEFSDFYPIISVILSFWLTFKVIKQNGKLRVCLLFALAILFINLILTNFTFHPSLEQKDGVGLRRYTPIIIAFYTIYIFSWNFVLTFKNSLTKKLLISGLVLLTIHHILVYPDNLMSHKKLSQFHEDRWFIVRNTPAESLNIYLDAVQKQDLLLVCPIEKDKPTFCRFDVAFSVIKGACLWNHLSCHNLMGLDPKTNKVKILSIDNGI